MKPPFEIYHDKTEIGDTEGHVCSAENPEIAKQIVAMLNFAAGWRLDTENMPTEGHFEALGAQPEVFRHMPNEDWVIIPQNGRMFKPYAWRPAAAPVLPKDGMP